MGEHCGDGRVLCCDCGGSKNEIHEINCMEVHTHRLTQYTIQLVKSA